MSINFSTSLTLCNSAFVSSPAQRSSPRRAPNSHLAGPTRRKPAGFEPATVDHVANFLDCIRRGPTPNGRAEAGHYATVIRAMAVHSVRHGGQCVRWNAETRAIES